MFYVIYKLDIIFIKYIFGAVGLEINLAVLRSYTWVCGQRSLPAALGDQVPFSGFHMGRPQARQVP